MNMKIVLIILVGIFLILQYQLWFAKNGVVQAWRVEKQVKSLEQKNDELHQRNTDLASEIDSLKKGGAAIETRARSDLGMVKKGEVFYQVVK
jgi:cell division protein FtsB